MSLSLVALAFAVFAASALAGSHAANHSYQFGGSITSADPVATDWIRADQRAECGGASATIARVSGTFHYHVYTFQNLRGWWTGGVGTGVDTCVNVSLIVYSGAATASGYIGTFDPSNVGVNWWTGTSGLAPGNSADFSYYCCSVGSTVPNPPATFQVVVFEAIPNRSATYTLVVEGTGILLVGGGPTATSLQSFRASSAPKGVLVRWTTSSEHEALGFNLYRGDKKKVRLTRSIVRASGNGRGHTYSYLDRNARKGKAAPYYLEVVQRSGSKIMFGPARR